MVRIPGGCFQMGSPDWEEGRSSDERQHRVCVDTYEIGKYEVTQGQWQAVMGDNPSYYKSGDDHPVEQVSWADVQTYLQKLNARTGQNYRLPTEAEWEYAARAGTTTAYWWGNQASHEHANYGTDECCSGLVQGKDRWENTAPVGSFEPNPWGLYDTVGNVLEWTCSLYEGNEDYSGAETRCIYNDASGPRSLRGGSWDSIPARVRSADRFRVVPTNRDNDRGFRLARSF
ncbi:MAG: formylglycine-generating enzyme family protein [Candidatus Competibacter sp.]|nr:formylglycine-generating enzyme family protein [Candidatus Competibacter sp.]MDG4585144.1 formylglycine-generating enzyme family protein [Candidatus Competibacter sp.]